MAMVRATRERIICTTYNRGMVLDMIFDRVELAQSHEFSCLAAPYYISIRTQKHRTQKNEASNFQTSEMSASKRRKNESCLFCRTSRQKFSFQKKKFLHHLFSVQNGLSLGRMGLTWERWCCAGRVCRLVVNARPRRVCKTCIFVYYFGRLYHGTTRRHETPGLQLN